MTGIGGPATPLLPSSTSLPPSRKDVHDLFRVRKMFFWPTFGLQVSVARMSEA
jgi:hypothetical protein